MRHRAVRLSPGAITLLDELAQAQGVLSAAQLKAAEGVFLNMQYRIALNQAMRAQAQPGQGNSR